MDYRYAEGVSASKVREELVATLDEILGLQRRLVAAARNPRVSAPELVAQVDVLERLDDRRDHLITELRREASADLRAARPGRPVREIVLEALDALVEFRWPQNAKFLEEYIFAVHQLQLDSRAFAPLRRDEKRAWERAPGARHAYIAPALREDGSPNPRWLTSSTWELERRIVSSDRTEELLNLQKILTLVGRAGGGAELARPRRPTDTLLERYAKKFLDVKPPSATADADEALAWRLRVRGLASERIGKIRAEDDPIRKQIAAGLAGLPEHDRIWGRSPGS
jgi:hypothetical protein